MFWCLCWRVMLIDRCLSLITNHINYWSVANWKGCQYFAVWIFIIGPFGIHCQNHTYCVVKEPRLALRKEWYCFVTFRHSHWHNLRLVSVSVVERNYIDIATPGLSAIQLASCRSFDCAILKSQSAAMPRRILGYLTCASLPVLPSLVPIVRAVAPIVRCISLPSSDGSAVTSIQNPRAQIRGQVFSTLRQSSQCANRCETAVEGIWGRDPSFLHVSRSNGKAGRSREGRRPAWDWL